MILYWESVLYGTYRGTSERGVVSCVPMGVTGLLPALKVQAETGVRYLKKACGSAVGVDLAG